ncbi:MAG: hypothetical protein A3A86_05810 [Elusimicrobia bacterium RIFCSPLOWO2_01_FULL_60_11]|nr:MAG: hypothetical protein A3A86_05810 [Elusimicrobia bacterium RIFCSPLOWO2_01_FULL_60_11]
MRVSPRTIVQKSFALVIGTLLALVTLELALRCGQFAYLSVQEHHNRARLKRKDGIAYRILCLGESTTMLGGNDSYPSQLEKILNGQNAGIRFSVFNKGAAGTKTGIIVGKLEANLDKYDPDMVIVMMGINDRWWVQPHAPSSWIPEDLRVYKLFRYLWENLAKSDDTENGGAAYDEPRLMKLLKLDPADSASYLTLGTFYQSRGRLKEAEEAFQRAPRRWGYNKLGVLYRNEGRTKEATEMCEKAVEIDPNDADNYLELGRCYHFFNSMYKKAMKIYEKGLELDPKESLFYYHIGQCYYRTGEFGKGEVMIKKALELDPSNDMYYIYLWDMYAEKGRWADIEVLLLKAVKKNPEDELLFGRLATYYRRKGRYREADEYSAKASRLRSDRTDPVTKENYRRLKETVMRRGKSLICVQYPMRRVRDLKAYFDSTAGVVFVDNEGVFRRELEVSRFQEIFDDAFAGDFGHCTKKGNRILAENVARAIMKEVFSRELRLDLLQRFPRAGAGDGHP